MLEKKNFILCFYSIVYYILLEILNFLLIKLSIEILAIFYQIVKPFLNLSSYLSDLTPLANTKLSI